MVKSKAPKKQQRGVDFKKIKRKIGRKLPPSKNTTDTEIKSKAIILPEQSVASEKAGLAVSKKGLTLKELLQQTSHHNPKVRLDALFGIKDVLLKHPKELRSHKLAVVEKLRERISDNAKSVHETLYDLLKSVIFPGCEEDNQGPFISLMMAYIFNAMTNLDFDVRSMAFKFVDLVIQHYPLSFMFYAEKIFQNYEDLLRKNQFHLQEKGNLKNVLADLVHCLSLLPDSMSKHDLPHEKEVFGTRTLHAFEPAESENTSEFSVINEKLRDLMPILVRCFQAIIPWIHAKPHLDAQLNDSLQDDFKYFVLNVKLMEIFLRSSEWHGPAASLEKFLEFIANSLSGEESDMHYEKALLEKNLVSLIPFIPRLALHVSGYWRSRTLQAFTGIFRSCSVESPVKWACLSAMEEMLLPQLLSTDDTEIFDYQTTWVRELPSLLIKLGNKQPSRSKSVLSLLLRLGQCAVTNSFFAQEYDSVQHSLTEFYCSCTEEGTVSYGPFVQLERDAQELCICCLYYLSYMDSHFLKAIVSCCLYGELESLTVFRIIEILVSAYKVGHIQMSDLISFFITWLARFKIDQENCPDLEEDENSNRGIVKPVTRFVCSCLLQMGDNNLVFQILEKPVLSLLSLKPASDNLCALLWILVALDSRPTRLSDESIINLSKILPGYLIDVVSWFLEKDGEHPAPGVKSARDYYLLPCLFLFYRSNILLSLVLNMIQPLVSERTSSISSHVIDRFKSINAIVAPILVLNEDHKIHQQLSSCKEEIGSILQSILRVQSEDENMAIDEKYKIQSAASKLRNVVNKLCSEADK